jgi:hypothetical protein
MKEAAMERKLKQDAEAEQKAKEEFIKRQEMEEKKQEEKDK